MKINFKKVRDVKTPEKAYDAAAYDLFIPEDQKPFWLLAGDQELIKLGIILELKKGYKAIILPRSGYAANDGLGFTNGAGLIDPDYRGELGAILRNYSHQDFYVCGALKIAQLMIDKVDCVTLKEVDEINTTIRGSYGFGSSGK